MGFRRQPRTSLTPTVGNRQALARLLEDIAAREGPGIGTRPEIAAFGDLPAALDYLHRRWVTRVGVAVDQEIEAGAEPLTAVWRAWEHSALQHPGLASVLDYYAEHPAVACADRRHRELAASAAGSRPEELPRFGTAESDLLVNDLARDLTSAAR